MLFSCPTATEQSLASAKSIATVSIVSIVGYLFRRHMSNQAGAIRDHNDSPTNHPFVALFRPSFRCHLMGIESFYRPGEYAGKIRLAVGNRFQIAKLRRNAILKN
jgi:hypothetical protein